MGLGLCEEEQQEKNRNQTKTSELVPFSKLVFSFEEKPTLFPFQLGSTGNSPNSEPCPGRVGFSAAW